jgi:hypothetical protein
MPGYTTHKRATTHINCPKCAPLSALRVDSNKPLAERLPERPQRRRAGLRDRCEVGCSQGIITVSSLGASAIQALLVAGETAEAVAVAREAVKAYRANRNAF